MPSTVAIVFLVLLYSAGAAAETLTIGAEENYYPYSAQVNGELVGLVPALVTAAYQEVGVTVDYEITPYKRVLMQVERGQLVGGFTGAIDASNEAQFHWHETPLATVNPAIWARLGAVVGEVTAKNLEGKTVSVTRGFFYPDAIQQNETIAKSVAPSDESSLKMLALGRSDYALVTEAIGRRIVQSGSDPFLKNSVEVVGSLGEIPLHAFFSRSHPEGKGAADLLQQGLEAIIAEGIYDRLIKRWLRGND